MSNQTLINSITALLKSVGKLCKIAHLDGSSTPAYTVITRPSKTVGPNSSVTDETLIAYVQGSVRKAPAVGDYLKVGATSYMVEKVDRVQPDGVTTYLYTLYVRA